MGLFSFRRKKQSPEEQAEMLYTEGMTLIANNMWDTAYHSIRQAADLGHRGAIGQLAMMHIFGQGCEQDPETGLTLLHRAVELGNLYACYAFSVLYDHGVPGVTVQEAEAMCALAANAGMEEAAARMEQGFDMEGSA